MFLRICLIFILTLTNCASRQKTGEETKSQVYNPTAISFLEIDTGLNINLAQYMADKQKDWLLLYFHSRTCTACVEKLQHVRDDMNSNTFKNSHFEFIGISADPISSLALVKNYKALNNFPFVKWLDDRGTILKDSFLPSNKVGVPFMALVTKDKILWLHTNDAEISYEQMVDQIKETVPPSTDPPLPTPTPTPVPTPTPTPSIPSKFNFYYQDKTMDINELLGNSKYTVINTFGELCSSCIDELQAWVKPAQAIDICKLPNCQFLNLENGYPEDEPTADRLHRVARELSAKGLNVELMLDPHPVDGDAYKDRYFDGYLSSTYPNWRGLFGAVIYKDGIIIKDFKAGNPQEVTDYLKGVL